MIFISLSKMRKKPVKGTAEQGSKIIDEFKNKGIKIIGLVLDSWSL